jgi:DoxX-like protein
MCKRLICKLIPITPCELLKVSSMISSFSDKNSSWNSFYNAGYTKLSNLAGLEHFFSNMIGLPAAIACIVGLLEVMDGIALIVGFLTRIDSIPL